MTEQLTLGDETEVLRAVDARFLRRLQHYARRYLDDQASAQDAVQCALEVLVKTRGQFRGESSFSTYVVGILRHKIGDELRRRRRTVQLNELDINGDPLPDPSLELVWEAFTAPEGHVHSARLAEAIAVGLEQLTPRGRQVFMMRERHGLDGAEISAQLGLTVNNTWVLLHRAKRQLRDSLRLQGYGCELEEGCNA